MALAHFGIRSALTFDTMLDKLLSRFESSTGRPYTPDADCTVIMTSYCGLLHGFLGNLTKEEARKRHEKLYCRAGRISFSGLSDFALSPYSL